MKLHFFIALSFLWLLAFHLPTVYGSNDKIRVAYFSQDPPSINSLSPAIDPDSYSVIAQIFDSLIHMDLQGNIKPALAVSWKQKTPTQWEFQLRKGVKFHNGEPFDGRAVKFTFDYILNPKNNAGNRWIFNTLESVDFEPTSPYKIIFNTRHADGMFLNRFNLFGSICPPEYIKEHGFQYFSQNPVGTGPFKFKTWKKNRSILLEKNPDYWQKNIPKVDTLEFLMLNNKSWVDAFAKSEVDFIPNLSGSETKKLMARSRGKARIIKAPVLISYWVLLKNEGALDNIDFRRAINYATNKTDLIHFADFGNALPLASLGKRGEAGANPSLKPYQFDPAKAKALVLKSGIQTPVRLNALVSDVAERPARIIQRNLKDIGVELTLEFVSRSEWTQKVVVHKLVTGKRPDYDMVINMVDNPIYNMAFHAGLFLESSSPWSLLKSDEFDRRFADALKQSNQKTHLNKLKDLDEYIRSEALMLFTTQKIITAAINKRFDINQFAANGHLGYEILSNAKVTNEK